MTELIRLLIGTTKGLEEGDRFVAWRVMAFVVLFASLVGFLGKTNEIEQPAPINPMTSFYSVSDFQEVILRKSLARTGGQGVALYKNSFNELEAVATSPSNVLAYSVSLEQVKSQYGWGCFTLTPIALVDNQALDGLFCPVQAALLASSGTGYQGEVKTVGAVAIFFKPGDLPQGEDLDKAVRDLHNDGILLLEAARQK